MKLSNGMHVVRFELRNNDHSPLPDPAFDWIEVEVAAPLPTVKITAPAAGSDLTSRDVKLEYSVANFLLNGSAVGKPAAPGASTGWSLPS